MIKEEYRIVEPKVGESEVVKVDPIYSDFASKQDESFQVFAKKQADYGPRNISDSYNAFGLTSNLVRMNDKMQRLINLNKTGETPNNESVRDSLIDLANYCHIALMCIDGEWPGVEKEVDQ